MVALLETVRIKFRIQQDIILHKLIKCRSCNDIETSQIDLLRKLIDWFLYDSNFGVLWVNTTIFYMLTTE